MQNNEDLLATNGLVSTKLFDVRNVRTIPANQHRTRENDTKEFLNRNVLTRDAINITQNLSQPWPTNQHKNDKPIISNTVGDITEPNYFKYEKSYLSIDSEKANNAADPQTERFIFIRNARYIIDLGRTYKDIYKIKLKDFAVYNLHSEFIPDFSDPASTEPITYTPYVLVRVQPVATKEFASVSNFQVASSEENTEIVTSGRTAGPVGGHILSYPKFEPYQTSLSKVRFFKPLLNRQNFQLPITIDDFIEPVYSETEMFYPNPIEDATRFLITVYNSEGEVYKGMQPHNFTLEITEKVNVLKNTNINTKEGEIDVTGVAKPNPLLFS